ncbi:MAG: hypothetical protein AAF092_01570 [Pseudomonadota bacterium]
MFKQFLPAVTALLLASTAPEAATLKFDTLAPGQTSNGTSLGGAPAVDGLTVDFLNVATDMGRTVDARVTATVGPQTQFGDGSTYSTLRNALIYDYAGSGAAPEDDLAFLYTAMGVNNVENGITLGVQFYDGTGAKSNSFTDTMSVKELEIAVYDVDGEPSQSEYFRAFRADGLVSYGLGNTPQALVATNEGGGVIRFDGPGTNFAETDATGAAILTYADTDFFQLSFGSVQSGGPNSNPVFSAIDGDLSLFDAGDFNVAPVSLPAGGTLLLSALGAMGWTRFRMAAVQRAALMRRARRWGRAQAV